MNLFAGRMGMTVSTLAEYSDRGKLGPSGKGYGSSLAPPGPTRTIRTVGKRGPPIQSDGRRERRRDSPAHARRSIRIRDRRGQTIAGPRAPATSARRRSPRSTHSRCRTASVRRNRHNSRAHGRCRADQARGSPGERRRDDRRGIDLGHQIACSDADRVVDPVSVRYHVRPHSSRPIVSGRFRSRRRCGACTRPLRPGIRPTAVSPESMTASVPSKMALATSLASARVGRGLWRIESSMSVAVMTGLPAARASAMSASAPSARVRAGSRRRGRRGRP